ncbi:NADH dehydrogenase [ubiquinone] (complex I), 21kDa subunit, fungi [Phaffia rhodozyma]|uniref:NADH dehydrogenase [ubiquinone] (Complex I), 21kDa subunit, fungi n=1 Tax=Phaffia rhodozyma TaxID=264483 RepID=A0A0F7SN41_PHARH|nr:NADH dehydrogenase [ubiquinone] (complex I), 21kDa subunit, fungi [Phaffia rhodozyma]
MPPKSADPTLYHVASKGFWKKLRDKTVINPEISTGLPIPLLNRYPPPGSRPEPYAVPATAASDPAFNPYWKRDTRRNYPATSVITQSYLTNLLLASPEGKAAIPGPDSAQKTAVTDKVEPEQTVVHTLPAVVSQIFEVSKKKTYDESNLPPVMPVLKRHAFQRAADPPQNEFDYLPMHLHK